MTDTTENTAALVGRFLVRHSLTQARLAQMLGVTSQTVSRWAAGRRTATSGRLLSLALDSLERSCGKPVGIEARLFSLDCPLHGLVHAWVAFTANDESPRLPPMGRYRWRSHCLESGCDPGSGVITAGEPAPGN